MVDAFSLSVVGFLFGFGGDVSAVFAVERLNGYSIRITRHVLILAVKVAGSIYIAILVRARLVAFGVGIPEGRRRNCGGGT